ncbi:MAG: hypothetical protein EAX90_06795 [Candidatus Heimdallarchaeota archaeon]|nr:hypothetical protein [Candidatus Heimdallarchaeota archaeon]
MDFSILNNFEVFDINGIKLGKIIRIESIPGEKPEELHYFLTIRVKKFLRRNFLFPLHEKYMARFHTFEKKVYLNFTRKYFNQLVNNYLIDRKIQVISSDGKTMSNLNEAQARMLKRY